MIVESAWLPIPLSKVSSFEPSHKVSVLFPQLLSFLVGLPESPDVCDVQSRSDNQVSPDA